MYQREIDNELNYTFCQQINDYGMKQQCNDYANFVKAKKQGDKSLCQQVNNNSVKQRCIVSAQRSKIELQLANTGILFGDEVNLLVDSSLTVPQGALAVDDNLVEKKQSIQNTPAPNLQWQAFVNKGSVIVDYSNHKQRVSLSNNKFTVVPGKQRGLHSNKTFNYNDFIEPFNYGRGMASGDFNNDQWPDMVFATANGAAIFQNLGNGHFQEHSIKRTTSTALNALVVAFVDINNDGWQDVFFKHLWRRKLLFHQ